MKACLFDLDGVIVDTAVYHFRAWRKLANELGFDFTEAQNEHLKGISRIESLNLILGWGNVTLSEEDKNSWASKKNEWYLEFVKDMNRDEILPGVVSFLNQLKQNNIKIALGSASKNSELILRKIELFDYFDAIIDGNNITKGKPNPEVFQLGAKSLELDFADCIVFEDAVAGVNAGKSAGMKVVGIGSSEILTTADCVFENFTQFDYYSLLKLGF